MTVAVASALAALAGVVLGQVLSGRNDHKKWVREQRFIACHDFVAGIDELTGSFDTEDGREQAFAAMAKIKLVCPWSVETRAHDVFQAAIGLANRDGVTDDEQLDFEELLVGFTNEARKMLGTHDRRRDQARHI